MKDKIFGVLQRVGRSFMLPIAILPVAGLLLGIGSSFTNATMIETYGLESILGEGTILNALLTIMSSAGNVIFDNLPLIFAVGVAIGMAKKEKDPEHAAYGTPAGPWLLCLSDPDSSLLSDQGMLRKTYLTAPGISEKGR